MVTETEDEDGEAWILKDLSGDGEAEALYEIVEDDEELDADEDDDIYYDDEEESTDEAEQKAEK